MRTVICVPRLSDGGRRDEIWKWLRHNWIEEHFPDIPIFEGIAKGAGNSRNIAAKKAGDWDVALFNDADTMAHPEAVRLAFAKAAKDMQIVIAADSHMYCSDESSSRIMAGGIMFPRPYRVDRNAVTRAVYPLPCSGVFAVSRKLWDATGGYIEMLGAGGCEDECFMEQARIFGNGIDFIPGHMTYHLWHDPGPDRYLRQPSNYHRNKAIWRKLARLAKLGDRGRDEAREVLATLGHIVP